VIGLRQRITGCEAKLRTFKTKIVKSIKANWNGL